MRPFTTNPTPKTTAAPWWSLNKIPRQEVPHSVKVSVIRLHNKLRTIRAYVQAVLSNNPWDLLGLFGVRNWSPVPPGEHKSKFVAPGTSDRPNILRIIGLSRASRQNSIVKSGDVRPFTGVPLEVSFDSMYSDGAFKAKRDKDICLECDLPATKGQFMCKEHYDKEMSLISSLSDMWTTSPNMGPPVQPPPAVDYDRLNASITPAYKETVDMAQAASTATPADPSIIVALSTNDGMGGKTASEESPKPKKKRVRKPKAKKPS